MPSEPQPGLVLVVEDNAANLMLTKALLERAGYRVVAARSAEEARDRLHESLPEAIIMDIQLPGEDGLTLTRKLKSDPATTGIPIVALTAYAMKRDRERILAAGCDGYIAKPINTRTFLADLRTAIQRDRASGEA